MQGNSYRKGSSLDPVGCIVPRDVEGAKNLKDLHFLVHIETGGGRPICFGSWERGT